MPITELQDCFNNLKTFQLRHLFYSIQGMETMAVNYVALRQAGDMPINNACYCRSQNSIFQQAIVPFEQNLQDIIKRFSYLRIKRWGRQVLSFEGGDIKA